MQGLPIISPDGTKLRKGSKLFFTVSPTGGLVVEAQSPGTLAQQRQFLLAEVDSRHLAYRVLDAFFGPAAIDPLARIDIGACLLYLANGFSLEHKDEEPDRVVPSWEALIHRRKWLNSDMTRRGDSEEGGASRPKWWPWQGRRATATAAPQPNSAASDVAAAPLPHAADDGVTSLPPLPSASGSALEGSDPS
jgi:hypothetical protein